MNQEVIMDMNIRIKLTEIFGKDLAGAQEAYAWIVEKTKAPLIVPVTKEVKIINA